ncbi:MAG: DNA polymerase III subunit, partial [Bacteroidota bacterium]|nr:DNA polymerase III subunit [Bacteroidota bacterium]
IGHSLVKNRLIETIKKNRISHAQLFLGPEGSGKLSLALAYAQYINCLNPTKEDSCGECKSCKKFQALAHPDLHFVFPVVRSPKISKPVSIDYLPQWREFLNNSKQHSYNKWLDFLGTENLQGSIYAQESKEILRIVNLKTFDAKYKIIIIYMPEKMNISAANKLLKAIEEPPPQTIFILVSEDESQIITTILSRTQLIKIPRLTNEQIFDNLKTNYPDYDESKLNSIAKISNGNAEYADEILQEEINPDSGGLSEVFELFKNFMRLAFSPNFELINVLIDDIGKLGREKQKNFIVFSLRLIRENFILNTKSGEESLSFLTKDESNFSVKFNQFINQNNIFALYEEFNKAYADLIRNASAKILFLDLILKTAKLLKIKQTVN